MKRASLFLAASVAFVCLSSAQTQRPAMNRTVTPPPKSISPDMQNIRVKLEITDANQNVSNFEVLTSNGTVSFENVTSAEKINEVDYHAIMHFDSVMAYQNGSYIVTYNYGQQKPYTTGEGVQYRDLGANGSAVIRLGEKFQLIKDPQQTISLMLERAEPSGAAAQ